MRQKSKVELKKIIKTIEDFSIKIINLTDLDNLNVSINLLKRISK